MKSKWWLISLLVCLGIASLSPLASSAPDGLERVAESEGFIGLAGEAPFRIIADYVFPGVTNEALATILAGLVGTLILFGIVYGVAWLVKSRKTEPAKQSFKWEEPVKHSFLDQYSDLNSLIHRLDPRTKLITTMAFILAVALTPPGRWPVFAFYFFLVATLVLLSRVPVFYILRRSLVIMPFVLLIAVFVPFFKGGEVAGSYNIWLWQVSVTHSGLQVLGNILAKAWLSILSLILLTSTTKITHLLLGLEQLHMPRVMVMILSFMYRYIFVLVDEVMRMKQARDSRNFGGGWWWQLRTIGNMVGTLFIRSYERGERVYAAMLARGFDGRSRTLSRLSFKPAAAYFAVGFNLMVVLAVVFNIMIG